MKKFVLATCVSLLIHILIVWTLLAHFISAPAVEAIEAPVRPEDAVNIVDLVEEANKIRPEKAKAVGVENNATSEETVAALRRIPSPLRGEGKGEGDKHPPPRPLHSREGETKLAMREPIMGKPRIPATAVTESLGTGLSALVPEDYFPDYNHGGHTYLNVLKRPGVDYFVGLKRAFKMAWDPIPPLREHHMANEVSSGTIKVVLGVSVDSKGNLDELFVLKGSGLSRYDQEALRTVRASSPFASPPPNLLADGTLRMSWTFVVYL